ncbi:MAG: hypothetical protein A2068_09445 [Ignavibacteria bacterium GWB2_35_6b]|nr:MAG: hypothetical protein A2068_09445 [Ignavibacteria bacterium GWB2_35_6b]
MKNQIEEAKKSFEELNEFIKSLDPLLKEKAIEILLPQYLSKNNVETQIVTKEISSADNGMTKLNLEEFLLQYNHDKPSDNVLLITAWLYSQFGTYPMTTNEISELANKAGLTIAKRVDMTLKVATREGKPLFRKVGKGMELTLAGEAFMKEFYKIKKGNKQRLNEVQKS